MKYLSSDPQGWVNLARVYYLMANYDQSEKAYLKSNSLKKNSISVLQGLANIYFAKSNYQKASIYYKKAINLYPDNSNLYFNYAKILSKLKKNNQSLEIKAKGYYLQNKFNLAKKELEKIPNLKNKPKILKLYISTLIILENYSKLNKILSKAISKFPKDDEFIYNKAQITFRQKLYKKTIKEILKYINKFPNSHLLTVLLAHSNRLLNNKTQALKLYKKAISIKIDDIQAREYIAQHYRKLGDKDNEFFHQAIAYYYKNDITQAKEILNWISKEFKEKEKLYYYQALIELKNKNKPKAINLLKKAIKLNKNFDLANVKLSEIEK